MDVIYLWGQSSTVHPRSNIVLEPRDAITDPTNFAPSTNSTVVSLSKPAINFTITQMQAETNEINKSGGFMGCYISKFAVHVRQMTRLIAWDSRAFILRLGFLSLHASGWGPPAAGKALQIKNNSILFCVLVENNKMS